LRALISPLFKERARTAARRAAATPIGMRLLEDVTDDRSVRARLLHRWSNQQAAAASFAARAESTATRFEDLVWLFDSNALNHGLARQEFAEAAYLWRVVRDEVGPDGSVAELGRYMGGTTFMLAAAGARVVSIDRREGRPGSDGELHAALAAAGLAERVELVTADVREYEPKRSFELILFDLVAPREVVDECLTHWWKAVAPLGSLIVRDGAGYSAHDSRRRLTQPVVEAAAELAASEDAEIVDDTPGSYLRLRKIAAASSR
jgi:predicted O-methyltransferase YrrM